MCSVFLAHEGRRLDREQLLSHFSSPQNALHTAWKSKFAATVTRKAQSDLNFGTMISAFFQEKKIIIIIIKQGTVLRRRLLCVLICDHRGYSKLNSTNLDLTSVLPSLPRGKSNPKKHPPFILLLHLYKYSLFHLPPPPHSSLRPLLSSASSRSPILVWPFRAAMSSKSDSGRRQLFFHPHLLAPS